MKTRILVLCIILCVGSFVFANGVAETTVKPQKSTNLVMITPTAADNLDAVIPVFEKKYGIKVDLITGSTGETFARIQAEKNNPSSDITWIGEYYAINDADLFEKYVSVNDSAYPEKFRNTSGIFTAINGTCPVIIWNTKLVPEGIKGYADILDPKFKGKIAFGDAATSSSAYNHLENMLLDFGNGDIEAQAGWDFVSKLLKQLDGRIVNSSSATYKGVVSGEYAIGLAWDAPALDLAKSGTPNVKFCYMTEGSASKLSGLAIVKNCKNLENAKLFVDFLTSQEGQQLLAMNTAGANPIRTDIEFPEFKEIMKTANIFPVDSVWSSDVKKNVQERYINLLMSIMK